MDYIKANNRYQIWMNCLEEQIEAHNQVRFIDAFVEKLDLAALGYIVPKLNTEGRPPFAPKLFLKLYLYGYLNGLRSSRRLERESKRNIELQWLLAELSPNYYTIADFRKVNGKALRNTFKLFVLFLKSRELKRNVPKRGIGANHYVAIKANLKTQNRHKQKSKHTTLTYSLKLQMQSWITEKKYSPELVSAEWEKQNIAGEITVIGIKDGDTIELIDERNQTQTIRLLNIDCPEKG